MNFSEYCENIKIEKKLINAVMDKTKYHYSVTTKTIDDNKKIKEINIKFFECMEDADKYAKYQNEASNNYVTIRYCDIIEEDTFASEQDNNWPGTSKMFL